MTENSIPVQSTATLVKALIAALIIAALIFVAVVLPAEFGIDPTGIGKRLGLEVLVPVETVAGTMRSIDTESIDFREDEITIEIPAGKGLEYKFYLEQYKGLSYDWSSGAMPLYFDLHGEPTGDTTGYFESFASATNSGMKGSFIAPFTGSHGWYWSNRSDTDAVITLKTNGNYEIIGLK